MVTEVILHILSGSALWIQSWRRLASSALKQQWPTFTCWPDALPVLFYSRVLFHCHDIRGCTMVWACDRIYWNLMLKLRFDSSVLPPALRLPTPHTGGTRYHGLTVDTHDKRSAYIQQTVQSLPSAVGSYSAVQVGLVSCYGLQFQVWG